MILQPIECIICRSKKTALGSSGYEDLATCVPNNTSGLFLHCNNDIIIQAPGLPRETSSSEIMYGETTSPRKRSFKALTNNDKPVYRQPKKLNSENAFYVETETNLIYQVNSKKEDLIWILARSRSSEFSPTKITTAYEVLLLVKAEAEALSNT